MKRKICTLAALTWLSFSAGSLAQAGTDPAPALAAFERACLASAPAFGDWKSIFDSAGVASLNRNRDGRIRSFPAGDAIVAPETVARNVGPPLVADCAVVLRGDVSKIAVRRIKPFLSSRQFPLKKRSDLTYTAQSDRERVVFQRAFRVDGRNFHVRVQTKQTEDYGLVTTLNASLVDDVN